ncbi:MAG: M56 family metallopeptidase [Armatimonadota bacterium]
MSGDWLRVADEIAAAGAGHLFRASWQGGIALTAAWGICRLFPRIGTRTRCWLWRLAYLKLLLALFWATPVALPVLPAPREPAPTPARVAAPSTTSVVPPAPARPAPSPRPSGVTVLLAVWAAGTLWLLARIAGEYGTAHWLLRVCPAVQDERLLTACAELCQRLGIRRGAGLLTAAEIASPLIVGLRRPAILLPTALLARTDAAEARLILAHELSHLRRRDLVWGWLPALVQALFWFHPLVWLGNREWRLAQELATDEAALAAAQASPAEYGAVLVKVAAQTRLPLQPGFATFSGDESPHALKLRLAALAHAGFSPAPSMGARAALAGAALLLLVPWQLAARETAAALPPAAPARHESARTETVITTSPKAAAPKAVSSPAPTAGGEIGEALAGLKSADAASRRSAVHRLAHLRPGSERPAVARALCARLKDADHFVRGAAAAQLAVWGGPESVPALIGALEDPHFSVQWAAIETLGKLKDLRAAEPLCRRVAENRDRGFAANALIALGPRAEGAVLALLRERDGWARNEACRILKEIGGERSLPALRYAAENDEGLVPMSAAAAVKAIEAHLQRRSAP